MLMRGDIKYIYGHGSGNRFVMIDAADYEGDTDQAAEFVIEVCRVFGSDGLLFVEKQGEYYAMNMYNTDGTQAQMCGNGMRLVARYVDENYIDSEQFTLLSGGEKYPIQRVASSDEHIKNYGVEIAIKLTTSDFPICDTIFLERKIEQLDPHLRFTYLNLGNPHIITFVNHIDLDVLTQLGERVKQIKEVFPNGVNVSMATSSSRSEIFVATYERGVGLTPSCGTAMTASSTAAALLDICDWEETITVCNRGGFVKCECHRADYQDIKTQLIGNASYIERGVITSDLQRVVEQAQSNEIEAWSRITSEQQ